MPRLSQSPWVAETEDPFRRSRERSWSSAGGPSCHGREQQVMRHARVSRVALWCRDRRMRDGDARCLAIWVAARKLGACAKLKRVNKFLSRNRRLLAGNRVAVSGWIYSGSRAGPSFLFSNPMGGDVSLAHVCEQIGQTWASPAAAKQRSSRTPPAALRATRGRTCRSSRRPGAQAPGALPSMVPRRTRYNCKVEQPRSAWRIAVSTPACSTGELVRCKACSAEDA